MRIYDRTEFTKDKDQSPRIDKNSMARHRLDCYFPRCQHDPAGAGSAVNEEFVLVTNS
jgi:hypothetical protein